MIKMSYSLARLKKTENKQKIATSVLAFCLFCLSYTPISFAAKFKKTITDCDQINLNERYVHHFGPFDYYDPANHAPNKIKPPSIVGIVEIPHLTKEVRRLERGPTARIADDLEYLLKSFPNHPIGLQLIIRYEQRYKSDDSFKLKEGPLVLAPECYLFAATKYKPLQPQSWILWGIYLYQQDRYDEALVKYHTAEKLTSPNAELFYNIGLTHFRLENFSEAKTYASKAKDLGYPMDGLINLLKEKGKW